MPAVFFGGAARLGSAAGVGVCTGVALAVCAAQEGRAAAEPGARLPAYASTGAENDFRDIVRSATDAVFPAVVYVRVVTERLESGRRELMQASGSGVLISPDGELLTNWHVVDEAIEVRRLLDLSP